MASTLDEIVSARRRSVSRAKGVADLESLGRRAESQTSRDFAATLKARSMAGEIAIIAELKKASPSRGLIRKNFDVARLASGLVRAGAAALSVLTEEEFFQGSLQNLEIAAEASGIPCLRKDFIVDEFQILEARAAGASAVLLIVAALSDAELIRLRQAARALSLDVVCEVHDECELQRALNAGFELVGVNNRNLQTFKVDIENSFRLAAHIPGNVIKVAESGIKTAADLRRLRDAGYDGFLIGESLMRAEDPAEALGELIASANSSASAPSR